MLPVNAPGYLERSNMLVLKVRASERSLWRLRIENFGYMISTPAFDGRWETVVINLGDKNRVGQLVDRTAAGGAVKLRIQTRGWDKHRNTSKNRWVTVTAHA